MRSGLSEMMRWVARWTGAVVNIEDLSGITLGVAELAVDAEQRYHHGTFCAFVKKGGSQPACARNKQRSIALAGRWKRPFAGCCPFGVWDSAWPIWFRDELVAVIYIGSLTIGRPLGGLGAEGYAGPPLREASEARRTTIGEAGRFLTRFIGLVLENRAGESAWSRKRQTADFYFQAMERFVEANHTRNIRLADLAAQLRRHPNYLGSLLRQRTGRSFPAYVREVRMNMAEVLLASTTKSVTEVAFACGFSDGNYFSAAFRRARGMTPLAYRKSVGHRPKPTAGLGSECEGGG